MNYSDEILLQMNYIDNLLITYCEKPMLINENFIIDDLSWEHYLKVKYIRNKSIIFTLILSDFGFQIDIDRTVELLDINIIDFNKKKNLIHHYLNLIFTCSIKVEYCGSHYTKIYFIDSSDKCIHSFKYITGFYLKFRSQIKKYDPIYKING